MSFVASDRTGRWPAPIVALVVAVVCLLVLVTPVEAATRTVCPTGCEFTDIASAVAAADAGDVIEVGAGTYPASGISITTDLVIEGDGRDTTIIDWAPGFEGVFEVAATGSLVLRDLTVQDGRTALFGAAVDSSGDLEVHNVRFEDNDALLSGGAIFQIGGSLTITDSYFTNNGSLVQGGAVWSSTATPAVIDETTFEGNDALGLGGALHAGGAGAQVTRALFATPTDTAALEGGSVAFSSFIGGPEDALTAVGGGLIDAARNWWGDPSGPAHASNPGGAGASVDDGVNFAPWIQGVEVTATGVSLEVGESVALAADLVDSTPAVAAGSGLPITITVTGANPSVSPSTDGTYSYVGAAEGVDTVIARPSFGAPGSSLSTLEGSTTVTWLEEPDDPDEDEDVESPRPEPAASFTPEQKLDALDASGIFTGLEPDPELLELLAQTGLVTALSQLVEVGPNGSTLALGAPRSDPDAWLASLIDQAARTGLGAFDPTVLDTEAAVLTVPRSVEFLAAVFGLSPSELLERLDSAAVGTSEQRTQVLPWGFVLDFSGSLGPTQTRVSPSGTAATAQITRTIGPLELGVAPGRSTMIMFEIAPEDLPPGVRPEQITLARLDAENLRWVPIESLVADLGNGRFGMLSWVRESGYYNVIVRPVAERTVHAGVTFLAWYGAEGQPPDRAVLGVDGSVQAIWAQDSTGRWVTYRPGAPAFTNTLKALRNGIPLMLVSTSGGRWVLPSG